MSTVEEQITQEINTAINKGSFYTIVETYIDKLLTKKLYQADLAVLQHQKQIQQSTPAVNSKQAGSKSKIIDSLIKEIQEKTTTIKTLELEIPIYSQRITTGYDSTYISDIQAKVDDPTFNLKIVREGGDPYTNRKKEIRQNADRLYIERTQGATAILNQYRKTSTGIKRSQLVSQMLANGAAKAKEAAQDRLNGNPPTPNPPTQKTTNELEKVEQNAQNQENKNQIDANKANEALAKAGASNTSGNGGEVADSNKGTNPSAPEKAEKVTAGLIEFFAPAVAEQKSFLVSQFNPLQYALINTQLLKGDKIDPRKIDFFVPQNYVTHVPAFMSIVQESTIPRLNTATGIQDNLPTIESPFETKNGTAIYNQFSLTQTIEMYSEKFQVDDTMSEGNVVYFFGQRPEIWTFSGTLLNDLLHAWHPKFRNVWHDKLRGSVLAKNKSYLVIIIPSSWLMVECYPIGMSISHTVEMENISPFTMSVFVKSAKSLPNLETRLAASDSGTATAINTVIEMADIFYDLKTKDNLFDKYAKEAREKNK